MKFSAALSLLVCLSVAAAAPHPLPIDARSDAKVTCDMIKTISGAGWAQLLDVRNRYSGNFQRQLDAVMKHYGDKISESVDACRQFDKMIDLSNQNPTETGNKDCWAFGSYC